jgi:hypothetical protein
VVVTGEVGGGGEQNSGGGGWIWPDWYVERERKRERERKLQWREKVVRKKKNEIFQIVFTFKD